MVNIVHLSFLTTFTHILNIFENYNFLLEEQTLIGNYELDNYQASSDIISG